MTQANFSLDGKVAMVTGSSGGIGKAATLAIAAAGADLIVVDLPGTAIAALCDEISKLGRKALAVECDVTRPDQVNAAVGKAIKQFGRIDVLFNNAGVGARGAFLDISLDEWDRVMTINLRGAFLVAQAVAREMVKRRSGSIISTASIAAFGGRNNVSAYAASKAGVELMSKCAAMELAPHGVRMNTISPGMIYSPFTSAFLDADGGLRKKQIGTTIPLGRVGYPKDLVGGIIYLASDASAYVTGQTIVMDGGWTTGVNTDDKGWTTTA